MADLITLDEYKAFASIEGKKMDPQIVALISSCSEIVQDYIGYPLSGSGTTEATIRTRNNVTSYMLPGINLDVQSIKYTPRGGTEITLSNQDFYASDTGLLELYTINPKDGDFLVVTYAVAATDLEAIKLATMLLVKYYYKEEFNKSSVAAGGQTVSYQTGKNFPPHVRAILLMHRMF